MPTGSYLIEERTGLQKITCASRDVRLWWFKLCFIHSSQLISAYSYLVKKKSHPPPQKNPQNNKTKQKHSKIHSTHCYCRY